MARPLRYEAAGAVYHVMARGDGGRTVFEDDRDRHAWLALMERACARFGWRVHAWVLMGNHFHLLLETPEPNLVAGMKWQLGVFSQDWNRRRLRRGHVFQGRYKAVVVNGEERDGWYFRIVADYIHLNPVRAGLVGGDTGKRLRSWKWSSFPAYAGGKAPEWLETGWVLRAFALSEDGRGGQAYAAYLEARGRDRNAEASEAALKELRRGWYLGEKSFAAKVLETIGLAGSERKKTSAGGDAARAHGLAEAERLASTGLKALGLPGEPTGLMGRGKWMEEKALLASLIRKRTGARNGWVASRLAMGHEVMVTRAVRKVREDRALGKRLAELEKAVLGNPV